jgi:mannose-1-phosphate guanylyltransferase
MKRIDKPWGYEIIFAQSDKYVGKILHINKGEQLSLQYHNIKDESIYLLSGVMELDIEEGGKLKKLTVKPGESFRIAPKVRHRFTGVEECDILEVSTPELHDVIRIEDKYGRINKNNFGVIMAGGHGTRFWPRSRRKRPKQLLDIISSEPMIRETIKRINKVISAENILVVANEEHRAELEKHIPEIPEKNLVFEPMAKNTATCIGVAAMLIQKINPDGIMGIFPADHLITKEDAFNNLIGRAFELASQNDSLITLGMKPTYPETGYGYIKCGKIFQSINEFDFYTVDKFIEKPERDKAENFVKSNEYYWNGGIFVWKTGTVLDSIKKYLPDLHSKVMEVSKRIDKGEELENILKDVYTEIEPISIDFGVLEHADNVLVVPSDVGWSDMGGWAALDGLIEKKGENDNISWSKHISIDTKECIIYSPKKLVATIGLEKIIIVETDDALLVSTKDRAQDVKLIVEKLKESGLEEYL